MCLIRGPGLRRLTRRDNRFGAPLWSLPVPGGEPSRASPGLSVTVRTHWPISPPPNSFARLGRRARSQPLDHREAVSPFRAVEGRTIHPLLDPNQSANALTILDHHRDRIFDQEPANDSEWAGGLEPPSLVTSGTPRGAQTHVGAAERGRPGEVSRTGASQATIRKRAPSTPAGGVRSRRCAAAIASHVRPAGDTAAPRWPIRRDCPR